MSEFIGSLLTALSGFDSEITKPVQILKEHPRYGLISTDICHLVKKKKKASSAAEESLYLVVYENLSLVIPFVTAGFFFPPSTGVMHPKGKCY